ncbi:MAG: PqqD family protein [Chloroflexi bacterium]|nr:PqqD family protein [Chloroflexota bacterium]
MTQPDLRKPVHNPHTASRVFSGEAVIVSPAENMVRLLNPVGSRIWELADGAHTVEEIAAVLTEEYAIELPMARESAAQFLHDLAGKELIAWA